MAEALPLALKTLAVTDLPVVVEQLKEFTNDVVKSVDSILETLEKVNNEGDEMQYKYENAKKMIKKFSRCAYNYIDAVDDVFYYACKIDKNKIKDSISCGDYKPLHEMLDSIQYYISKANDKFTELKAASLNAEETCVSMAEHCNKLFRKAKTKQTKTKVVGGAGSAAVIAGGVGAGVALSVVAGVFTFGVGTIVGLSLTAAGATVAGVGIGTVTAGVTHIIASDFEEAKKKFADYAVGFDELNKTAICLDNLCENVKSRLELISKKTEDCDYHLQQKHTVKSVDEAVEFLFKKLDTCHSSTARQRSLAKDLNM